MLCIYIYIYIYTHTRIYTQHLSSGGQARGERGRDTSRGAGRRARRGAPVTLARAVFLSFITITIIIINITSSLFNLLLLLLLLMLLGYYSLFTLTVSISIN